MLALAPARSAALARGPLFILPRPPPPSPSRRASLKAGEPAAGGAASAGRIGGRGLTPAACFATAGGPCGLGAGQRLAGWRAFARHPWQPAGRRPLHVAAAAAHADSGAPRKPLAPPQAKAAPGISGPVEATISVSIGGVSMRPVTVTLVPADSAEEAGGAAAIVDSAARRRSKSIRAGSSLKQMDRPTRRERRKQMKVSAMPAAPAAPADAAAAAAVAAGTALEPAAAAAVPAAPDHPTAGASPPPGQPPSARDSSVDQRVPPSGPDAGQSAGPLIATVAADTAPARSELESAALGPPVVPVRVTMQPQQQPAAGSSEPISSSSPPSIAPALRRAAWKGGHEGSSSTWPPFVAAAAEGKSAFFKFEVAPDEVREFDSAITSAATNRRVNYL